MSAVAKATLLSLALFVAAGVLDYAFVLAMSWLLPPEAYGALGVAQATGPARPRVRDLGQALGEDPAWAAGRGAAEPACPHLDGDGAPLPGQVGEGAGVAAVDPPGEAAAERASTPGRRGHGDDGDAVGRGQDPHDGQTRRDQRRQTVRQRWNSDLRMDPSYVAPGRPTCHPTRLHQKRG